MLLADFDNCYAQSEYSEKISYTEATDISANAHHVGIHPYFVRTSFCCDTKRMYPLHYYDED